MKTLRSILFAGSLAVLGLTGCATTESASYSRGKSGPLTEKEMDAVKGEPYGYQLDDNTKQMLYHSFERAKTEQRNSAGIRQSSQAAERIKGNTQSVAPRYNAPVRHR